jgi:DNA-binding NarL/FixJ family response regulator
MNAIRIVIVDDHPVFRLGLAALLASLPGLDLAGQAADATEALQVIGELQPALVLMDLQLPGASGITVTEQIRLRYPQTAVLMLTMHETDDAVLGALRAGASGYVLKGASPEELERAIRVTADGGTVFSAGAGARVRSLLSSASPPLSRAAFPGLTPREADILEHVARGDANHVIARSLRLSTKTIANNVSNILVKLSAGDRAELIRRAREAGL